ncbi:hypothetical protein ABB37_06672 [Leptomonas pyrrhocoris]|uniref:Endonuclease/exonuclease/phosphatase domain-containing protein n=1 Tax=Leptomonas pyrrhocoris TaxID=157538 RepID=A0A0N0VEC0_LEPPY|nr:hypothetical protein ABB37_06672 [Leptomonas pyrrhocoris]KPA77878.1 hypothetical protein ABB37_06672 [Leptomonas pyrrhocoris]|eukprot:XP_015656317.1 hypothetical protein ABB37_06672 [Leptomonas pyrrhocoris]
MSQRIPLLCEVIRRTAPDVVALQDSTPELAAALTAEIETGEQHQLHHDKAGDESEKGRLKVYGAELARELQQPHHGDGTRIGEGESTTPISSAAAESSVGKDEGSTSEDEKTEASPARTTASSSSVLSSAPCNYRLIGRARNGHCGEVQLFLKTTSRWEGEPLPGMGAGLTMELRSRPTADTHDETAAATPSEAKETNTPASASVPSPSPPPHRCVLTTLDLSYRGKSLGTHLQGLLSDAAVSEEGSPFTLQTQQPSSATASPLQRRGGRVVGQLDTHRAVVFDWVHHHIRPDVLVGNVFMGARERVPGCEDAWVWAGSPMGQERTTNTYARHRVDHLTNYFYFKPSPGVASKTAMERAMRVVMEEEQEEQDELRIGSPVAEAQGEEEGREDGATEATLSAEAKDQPGGEYVAPPSSSSSAAAAAQVVVPSDAAVGTPIPFDAYVGDADGAWYARSTKDANPQHENRSTKGPVDASPSSPSSLALSDLTTGMPEVAGRFQRCFFRSWVRRGPSSRSGHLSARPLLRQYRRCRVVVLRPMTEVELASEERAWHARYITTQYSRAGRKAAKRQQQPVTQDVTDGAAAGEDDTARSANAPLRVTHVPSRVRCSLSDQYPLLTLLS